MLCGFQMYKISDFNIKINERYSYNSKVSKDYLCDYEDADCCIEVNQADLDYQQERSDSKFCNGYLEHIAIHRNLAEWLTLHNDFVLHSACFDVDGTGAAFSAHSGTGKTTHMNLWQELLGDKMVIVNGDKPIVRFLMMNSQKKQHLFGKIQKRNFEL